MPALNIEFTEAELDKLRKRSEDTGVSMRRLVHDAAVQDTARATFDGEVLQAGARVMELSKDLLKRLADQ